MRPWVLMRMLDIPLKERLMPFGGDADAFRAFSPTGKVPCLVSAGVAVWDSLAITEYLAERHPGVWPREVLARTWARCATAEMHSGFGVLRERCTFNCGIRVDLGPVRGYATGSFDLGSLTPARFIRVTDATARLPWPLHLVQDGYDLDGMDIRAGCA